jgi:tetratricopeptide (TPR) repeat protein
MQIAQESGNRWGMGLGLEQLAGIAQSAGDYEEARRLLEESVALHREIGDPWSLTRALNAISQLALVQSNLAEAERYALAAIKTAMEVHLNALDAISTLAEVHAWQEKYQSAFEIGQIILKHAGSSADAGNRAAQLLAEIEGKFTAKQVEAMQIRVQAMTLDDLVREILPGNQ